MNPRVPILDEPVRGIDVGAEAEIPKLIGSRIQFPSMLSTRVGGNPLTDNAHLGIVAVGMTLVILSGRIDLPAESVVAFPGVFIAVLPRGRRPCIRSRSSRSCSRSRRPSARRWDG